jgi:hypothetical protein
MEIGKSCNEYKHSINNKDLFLDCRDIENIVWNNQGFKKLELTRHFFNHINDSICKDMVNLNKNLKNLKLENLNNIFNNTCEIKCQTISFYKCTNCLSNLCKFHSEDGCSCCKSKFIRLRYACESCGTIVNHNCKETFQSNNLINSIQSIKNVHEIFYKDIKSEMNNNKNDLKVNVGIISNIKKNLSLFNRSFEKYEEELKYNKNDLKRVNKELCKTNESMALYKSTIEKHDNKLNNLTCILSNVTDLLKIFEKNTYSIKSDKTFKKKCSKNIVSNNLRNFKSKRKKREKCVNQSLIEHKFEIDNQQIKLNENDQKIVEFRDNTVSPNILNS